jgi:hypothetical protein
VEGALKYFYGRNDLVIRETSEPGADAISAVRLIWDYSGKRLSVIVPS